jgi:glutaminase
MMKEKKAFPPCFTNLTETLEIYFQICSILSTSSAMSVMAATLANGGLNPLSGARVFATEHVRNVLPLMLTSGMYDYSGQWAYDIGVPAKSGVGGCVFIVIPNVCGIAIWSPRLDQVGNSARGVAVAKALVNRFQFHNFEVFSGLSATKTDPTLRRNAAQEAALFSVLFAASEGDEAQLAQLHNAGVSLAGADYDSRTALHLAASEGHSAVLRFLVGVLPTTDSAVFSPVDRWGGTPLSDAIAHSHVECVRILREAGAEPGTATPAAAAAAGGPGRADAEQGALVKSREISRALFAAAAGDLDELVVLRVDGADLSLGDYDRRTALHLAASNGHPDIVRYLLAQAGDGRDELIAAKDRWGNTALDDATRERVRYASGTPVRAQYDRCGELLSE